ncbi:hypothetical protein BU23DRAFT_604168, partial [Bimuria novae-zelandiae CBS 107.79]
MLDLRDPYSAQTLKHITCSHPPNSTQTTHSPQNALIMSKYFSFALWGPCAVAAVLTAPTATITAPASLHKRAVTTVGYYLDGSRDGTTLWGTVTYETEGAMVGTSGSLFALCASNSCDFGSCSGDTYVMRTTAVAWYEIRDILTFNAVLIKSDSGSASSLTCSSNLLYSDVFDTTPLTNFFCDTATVTGYVLYEKTPGPTDGPIPTLSSSTSSASSPSRSTSRRSSPPSSVAPSTSTSISTGLVPVATTGAPEPKKSTPIGAIVGGAIGGFAVIGALVVAAVILIRRGRATPPSQTTYAMPPQQESKPYVGIAVAPPPEKTPAATTNPYAVEVDSAPAPSQSPVP